MQLEVQPIFGGAPEQETGHEWIDAYPLFYFLLSSHDRKVQDIAWAQLTSTVKKRRGINEVSTRDIQDFLNHLPLPQERNSRDVKSIWSTARKALNHLSCSVSFDGPNIMLNYDGTTEAGQKETIRKTLRKASDNYRLNELLEAKDQGRSFHLVHKHWSSNHWIHSGVYTIFADNRFAIRARLNLLPSKTVVKRAGKSEIDVTCPRCRRSPETLAHILNTCTPNAGLMRERQHHLIKISSGNTERSWKCIHRAKDSLVTG
jgi:hypothetical protein